VAAPEYVPQPAIRHVRAYSSPPRRPEPWHLDRPGETPTGFPRGHRFGAPGPDQGYVLRLARRFGDRVRLAPGEDKDDVITGCAMVALKRASLLGRAPVIHDLTVAATVWGFLSDDPPDELVELRRERFAEVSNPHYYAELRHIADMVPEDVLRKSPDEVTEAHRKDWQSLLDL
jgi:hypothetical protein